MKHKILPTLFLLLSLISTSCGASSESKADSQEAISVAVDYGKAHAQRLLDAYPDTVRMEVILLETRAKESELRETGHNEAADQYIKAFEDFVRQNNEKMAGEIFE